MGRVRFLNALNSGRAAASAPQRHHQAGTRQAVTCGRTQEVTGIMGQEISGTTFSASDAAEFVRRLANETALLRQWLDAGRMSSGGPLVGCELEAWLVDRDMNPAPVNREFLAHLDDPASSPELAKFNVEFNTDPVRLTGAILTDLERQLDRILTKARRAGDTLDVNVLLIGILPTLQDAQLIPGNLSELNRYRALNEQVLMSRMGQPVRLNITGRQPLVSVHHDVMLEAATTSFQLHWQVPAADVAAYYHALLMASAAIVAAGANSPFLFGHDLWAETRIPLFEQAIPVGGYQSAARGPLHRVGFGTGWIRRSIGEVFDENLQHFPVLLPQLFDLDIAGFAHLRLHNGTIWRWNRPLIGFDEDGTPHIRLEHRVMPAGPSVPDMVANAAFLFGLVESLASDSREPSVQFAEVRDNFYLAARNGLNARLVWRGEHVLASSLILRHLLPQAGEGLRHLDVDRHDMEHYLGIIEQRVESRQTGSEWQRAFIARNAGDFSAMTKKYLDHQQSGQPVHAWPL